MTHITNGNQLPPQPLRMRQFGTEAEAVKFANGMGWMLKWKDGVILFLDTQDGRV